MPTFDWHCGPTIAIDIVARHCRPNEGPCEAIWYTDSQTKGRTSVVSEEPRVQWIANWYSAVDRRRERSKWVVRRDDDACYWLLDRDSTAAQTKRDQWNFRDTSFHLSFVFASTLHIGAVATAYGMWSDCRFLDFLYWMALLFYITGYSHAVFRGKGFEPNPLPNPLTSLQGKPVRCAQNRWENFSYLVCTRSLIPHYGGPIYVSHESDVASCSAYSRLLVSPVKFSEDRLYVFARW